MAELIRLGNKVRDLLTGFEGIAIGRTEWLFGCTRIGVEPTHLHEGKPIPAEWFDEQRLAVLLEESGPVRSPAALAPIGGPQRDPQRPAPPTR